jgi:hypothetical protein
MRQARRLARTFFSAMNNLVWSADGNIYVSEDDGEAEIWLIDRVSLQASYASLDFSPDATQVYSILDADLMTETS